jgi:hypothetical protein
VKAESSRKWGLLVLLAVLVLLSGCIKRLELREDISPDGMSLFSMTLEPLNKSAFGWDKKNPCDDVKESNDTDTGGSQVKLKDIKCKYDGKAETVSGKFNRKAAGGLTVTGNNYRFDLRDAIDGLSAKEDKPAKREPMNRTQMREMKKAGIIYTYTVKMPGTVTKSSGGTLQLDGSVKFDLTDDKLPENPYVESSTGLLGGLSSLTGGGGDKQTDDSGDTGSLPSRKPAGQATSGASQGAGIVKGLLDSMKPCTGLVLVLISAMGAIIAKTA